MRNNIKIQFLGGVEEVGRLAMVLETTDIRLLFEYGISPGKPPLYPLPPPPVDLLLLTHAHLDHSGMIPWLFSRTDQKILTTDLTSELAYLLHKDSINIAKSEGYAIPFTNADAKDAKHAVEPVTPSQKKTIGDNYEIIFHPAGHIPGSLMFELVGDRKILFTGDFNVIDTRLVKGTKPVKCDILFLEGTYAGRDHPKKRSEIEKDLIDKIDEVVRRGGIAILPAFAVARSQELALVLKNTGFNIWFDGMGKKVSKMFLKHPRYIRSPDELKKALNRINFVHSDHGRKLALKADVIITSSGMMDGGPVLNYLNKLKNDKKSAVLLTGYQVEDSNARLLVDKGKLDFYGVIENVECEVGYFDFSAHAGHSELIEFAEKCNPEKIILMHSDNREALVEPLKNTAQVYTPKTGETLEL
ncbi:MAG: MBL fold metallo-hydrolase [Thermoplasmata archaeon]|nr:MAG: MBL fold metallo-hydrolase [Thermoplasmata archaeon]RLF33009.1 MAG: MBL fold metallo-hydrolase [Thermoplasmata archaeon]RLF36828.1 MAG: MBL fold metallo-hydrolase [Thermoplasmata archaeon]RLF52513.1 MAG: MBL fold metallo-hydrolase [Thermoplasmata archaeon]